MSSLRHNVHHKGPVHIATRVRKSSRTLKNDRSKMWKSWTAEVREELRACEKLYEAALAKLGLM